MPAPTTLSELIALYLARCRIEGLSPRTQRAYSETLARFQRSVAAQGAPDAAAAVETATVIRYCETFQARRPATRHRYFREVRCFFNWCVAAGFLDHTPFRGLRNVRLPSEVVQPFRPAELARLVGACDPATAVGRRDAAVVLLFLDTGIRCAELSALDLADCDLPRGRLLIRHGKGNKQRVVPFARRCQAALEAYLAVRGPTPGPLVWAVTGPGQLRPGVRLQPNGLKQLLRRRGRAAHVPRCHAHRFRHTFATWAIQQDARELDVQHLLGHAGPEMVRRYTASYRAEDAARRHARFSPADQMLRASAFGEPAPPPPPPSPVLALKLHCSFLSGSPPNSAGPRFANRLQMLPKQRVEGSNPFSRSNFATVAVWSHRARCLDGEPAGSAAEVEHALTGRDAGALEQERSAGARRSRPRTHGL